MDRTDRKRLQQVQQTDLTESRINEDFLYWLKTSGPSWLLAILVVVCGYLVWHRWQVHRAGKVDAAWQQLAEVQNGLPASLEEVANDASTANVGSVQQLARLQAADQLLRAVQLGRALETTETAVKLSEEERTRYLDRADKLYSQVVDAASGDPGTLLQTISALFGRAAVHESRGQLDQATGFYNTAAAKANNPYPALADEARSRAASVSSLASVAKLPDGPAFMMPGPSNRIPVTMDDTLRSLLNAPSAASP
jgi:predicted negative regulator of RcsB-dependent stress response